MSPENHAAKTTWDVAVEHDRSSCLKNIGEPDRKSLVTKQYLDPYTCCSKITFATTKIR